MFENSQVRVIIAKDGTVTYEQLGEWQASWGTQVNITFGYLIGYNYNGNGVTLVGSYDPAHASASITLKAPVYDDDDDDDDDRDIPLGPGTPDEQIPLGLPRTGDYTVLSMGLALSSLASFAALLVRRKKNEE